MPFPSSSQYELELKQGDVVVMSRIREDGWCKGTLQRSGQTGLFPLSFVEKISWKKWRQIISFVKNYGNKHIIYTSNRKLSKIWNNGLYIEMFCDVLSAILKFTKNVVK